MTLTFDPESGVRVTRDVGYMYMCTRFEKRSFNHLQNIESAAKYRNWVTSSRPRPLGGQFAICEQELPAVCQCATFEERSLIRDEDMAHFPSKD